MSILEVQKVKRDLYKLNDELIKQLACYEIKRRNLLQEHDDKKLEECLLRSKDRCVPSIANEKNIITQSGRNLNSSKEKMIEQMQRKQQKEKNDIKELFKTNKKIQSMKKVLTNNKKVVKDTEIVQLENRKHLNAIKETAVELQLKIHHREMKISNKLNALEQIVNKMLSSLLGDKEAVEQRSEFNALDCNNIIYKLQMPGHMNNKKSLEDKLKEKMAELTELKREIKKIRNIRDGDTRKNKSLQKRLLESENELESKIAMLHRETIEKLELEKKVKYLVSEIRKLKIKNYSMKKKSENREKEVEKSAATQQNQTPSSEKISTPHHWITGSSHNNIDDDLNQEEEDEVKIEVNDFSEELFKWIVLVEPNKLNLL